MTQPASKQWIEKLSLIPHPEGGWYKEVFRSELSVTPTSNPTINRSALTQIYYLLEGKQFSAFHRLTSDETWHFYAGNFLTLLEIDQNGILNEIILGNSYRKEIQHQYTIKAGNWFAAHVFNQEGFALLGCSVAPGFVFDDFFIGKKNHLSQQFPHLKHLIEKYCIE